MNRGGRREAFFEDEAHRQGFVQTLGEPSTKTGWQVHAVGKTRPICPLWRAIWTQAASCAAASKCGVVHYCQSGHAGKCSVSSNKAYSPGSGGASDPGIILPQALVKLARIGCGTNRTTAWLRLSPLLGLFAWRTAYTCTLRFADLQIHTQCIQSGI